MAPRPTRMAGRGCWGIGWAADYRLVRCFFAGRVAFALAGALRFAGVFLVAAAFLPAPARFAGAAFFLPREAGGVASSVDQSTDFVAAIPAGSGTFANRQRSRIWICVLS